MKKYILTTLFLTSACQADSFINLKSDQGDWIGGGQNHELTGDFNLSISTNRLSINHQSGFNFRFTSPNNRKLEKGVYLSAERDPFRGPLNPGIAVGSSGRGCNNISGSFYIYEIEQGSSPKLAMDFIQFCDSATNKLTGSIRLNSDIPAPYNLPLAVITNSSGRVMEGSDFVVSAADSISNNSSIEHYAWSQVSGPDINISDINAEAATIEVVDEIKLGGEKVTLQLTVTDALGQSASAEYPVTISSKSDPQSYFRMSSEAGDYIGAGKDWSYNLSNSTISASKNYDNGISLSISGSERWSADFVAPDDVKLEEGSYNNAERFPFQGAGNAGLSISGNGRGCNKNYGNFKVSQMVWENDQPKAFKASFEQYCERLSAPLLSGTVAFNAVHESVPEAQAGTDITIKERQIVNLNGSDSYDNLGSIVSYLWQTDEDVTIESSDESRAYFIAPELGNRVASKKLTVSLLVKDNEGYKAKDEVTVTVLANNQAPTANNDEVVIEAGESIEIMPLTNDRDEDGSLLSDSIRSIQSPAHGTFIIKSAGVIEYQHSGSGSVATTDTIIYRVKDNDGAESNQASITIKIQPKKNGGEDTDNPKPKPDTEEDNGGKDTTDPDSEDKGNKDNDNQPTNAPEKDSSVPGGAFEYWFIILLAGLLRTLKVAGRNNIPS